MLAVLLGTLRVFTPGRQSGNSSVGGGKSSLGVRIVAVGRPRGRLCRTWKRMADGLGQRRQEAKILAPTSVIIILGVPPASEPWSVTTASGMRVTMRLSEQSASCSK